MKKNVWNDYIDLESKHPWYLARKNLVINWANFHLGPNLNGLELGSGSGYIANELVNRNSLEILATDVNPEGIAFAKSRGLNAQILHAEVSEEWPKYKFDFIIAMDVLEHIHDDKKVIQNIFNHLRNNGKIFITVPALNMLWSRHDIDNQHFRRYSKNQIVELLESLGIKITKVHYWNSILMPVIYLQRVLLGTFNNQNRDESFIKLPKKLISNLIFAILNFETKYNRVFGRLPGASLIIHGQKDTFP